MIPKWLDSNMIGIWNDSKMIGIWNDSKMIGIEKCQKTTSTMINEVNTMTPRQNDLVVKNYECEKVKFPLKV